MTTTTNLAITKIDSSQAQKEVTANEAFDVLDAALSEISIAMSDANYTLSSSTTPKEWQYGTIKISGALTANRNVVVPTNKKTYEVVNGTSGGFSIVFKTSAGSGVTISPGITAIVRCDGTDVVAVTSGSGIGTVTSVNISSTDLSVSGGPITTSGSLTVNINNDAVTYDKIQNVSATSRLLGRVTAGAGDVEEVVLDTDTALAGNSDSRVPTQKAVKAYADGVLTATAVGSLIDSATAKTTPVDADQLGLMDSAASNILKKLSWLDLKATLKTYFDTLYATLSQPFDLSAFYPGVPGGSTIVMRVPVARSITFPANFTGSKFAASANATATTVFDIKKNGSSVGSISIAAGTTTATFTSSGGAAQSFVAGDVLSIVCPASPDTTLSDPGFVLSGTR
jgi:hypothetical protein